MKNKKCLKATCTILCTALTGCSAGTATGPVVQVEKPESVSYEDRWNEEKEMPDESFMEALRAFSYSSASSVLTETQSDIHYSPVSLYLALSLAASGADGETQQQILSLVGSQDSMEQSRQCSILYNMLYFENEVGRLIPSASIWVDQNSGILDSFALQASRQYYASMYSVNFKDDSIQKQMNAWIKEETHGLLQDTSKPDPETILSILQTICFMDEWMTPFAEENTTEGTFETLQQEQVDALYMNGHINCAQVWTDEKFIRAGLGLKNGAQMLFVLPSKDVSVLELVQNEAALKDALEGGEEGMGEINWQIPRFRISSSLNLKDMLKQMGMTDAFEAQADFSKMVENENVFLSDVQQDTMIAVDEKGVQAAVCTRLDFETTALMNEVYDMKLDRAFLYALEYNGVLLFVGICTDPS